MYLLRRLKIEYSLGMILGLVGFFFFFLVEKRLDGVNNDKFNFNVKPVF